MAEWGPARLTPAQLAERRREAARLFRAGALSQAASRRGPSERSSLRAEGLRSLYAREVETLHENALPRRPVLGSGNDEGGAHSGAPPSCFAGWPFSYAGRGKELRHPPEYASCGIDPVARCQRGIDDGILDVAVP